MSKSRILLTALAVLLLACSAGPTVPVPRTRMRPIIGGDLDQTHDAVVMVYSSTQGAACSGTIIAVNGADGFVLTAAHCVQAEMDYVLQGDDTGDPDVWYPVADSAIHPSWDGANLDYDLGMLRFTGASAATPVIPVASAPDGLAVGTSVTHVGYGLTSVPDGETTQRHVILSEIDDLMALQFGYSLASGGPCSGDSGGPSLSTGGPERVVGVIAAGDQDCAVWGTSVRVAPHVATFIQPFLDGTPPVLTCTDCRAQATGETGACRDLVTACLDDAGCVAYVSCLESCSTDPTCEADCAIQQPDGAALYAAIDGCVCTEACIAECADDPLCASAPRTCTGPEDCGSSVCVDGYCCDRACDGQCEACDLAASPGVCGPVTGAPHGARDACASDGSSCGGTCDGGDGTACTYPTAEASCLASDCADGRASAAAVCDGLGACEPAATTDCTPFVCDGTSCALACDGPAGCVDGYVCSPEGDCVAAECETREDCGTDERCASGQCVPDTAPEDGGAGCSCRSTGAPGGAGPWLLLALLHLLARRRRREGPAARG